MIKDINFWSQKNYMKRDSSSDLVNMVAPVTDAGSGAYYKTDYVVTHNLGYIPLFFVYYEPFGDGVIWPPLGVRGLGAGNPRGNYALTTGPSLTAYPTETTLTLELSFIDASLAGNYPVYWVIYRDYGIDNGS